MLQHGQIHYSDKPVVEMYWGISRSKYHEKLRLNAQKAALESWTQKEESDMGEKKIWSLKDK